MGLLSKFLRLPAADRRLLMKVMLLVWMVRMGLWLIPFRVLRQLLAKLARRSVASSVEESALVARIAWAVSVTSRYVPLATCLTQALVTKLMLARYGCYSILRIGVARSDAGRLQAHAWVESSGKIVIGGAESSLKNYTTLMALDGELW
jgi:hypothetical protein